MKAPRRLTLENGMRVLLEPRSDSRSVAVSLDVARGSRHEGEGLGGITHFAEHMIFKGTGRRDLFAIARESNLLGGQLNASTSNDSVRLTTRIVTQDLSQALDLACDLVWHSTFPEAEVERERGVILEEIGESIDNPEDLCFENFLKRLWYPHPVGRPVLGEPEDVESFPAEAIREYWRRISGPQNLILSLAGGFEPEETGRLVAEVFNRPVQSNGSNPDEPEPAPHSGRLAVSRDLEQVQFCLGLPAFPRTDPRRYALGVFDLVLGGGMGSRLFNEIRERRGLVYTIASTITLQLREGFFLIYGSTSPKRIEEVLALSRTETCRLAQEGPTDEELEAAKRQMTRGYLLGLESNVFRATRNAERELHGEPPVQDDEVLRRVESITREEVLEAASAVLDAGEMALSLVGPVDEEPFAPETVASSSHRLK